MEERGRSTHPAGAGGRPPPEPRLRLGVRLEPRAGAGDDPDGQGLLALADAAERAGIDILWIAERPFAPGTPLAATLPLCAAVLAVTRSLRVGAGVLALPLHHPLRLAEDVGTLAAISGDRLELAVGLGRDVTGFDALGVDRRQRVRRFEEGYAVLSQALRGEPVRVDGEFYQLEGVRVVPAPAAFPPLWIGARAAEAVERAARLGAGLLSLHPDGVQRYLAAWRAAGATAADARVAFQVDPADFTGAGAVADLAARAGCGQLDLLVRLAWPPPRDAVPPPLERWAALRDELVTAGSR